MTRSRAAWMVVLLVLSAGLAGCDKKVDLVFHNNTPQVVDVAFDAPPMGRQLVGPISAGGVERERLEIPKDDLPAQVTWYANGNPKSFMVYESSKSPIHLYIDSVFGQTGPIDENTELLQQRSYEDLTPRLESQQEIIVP